MDIRIFLIYIHLDVIKGWLTWKDHVAKSWRKYELSELWFKSACGKDEGSCDYSRKLKKKNW